MRAVYGVLAGVAEVLVLAVGLALLLLAASVVL